MAHAQEMDPDVTQAHIDLYVNKFTEELGEDGFTAVEVLLGRAMNEGLVPAFDIASLRYAVPSVTPACLADSDAVSRVPFAREAVVNALAPFSPIRITAVVSASGVEISDIYAQIRVDGERYIVVLLNSNREQRYARVRLSVNVDRCIESWDCLTGTRFSVPALQQDGWTSWSADFAPGAELAFVLVSAVDDALPVQAAYAYESLYALPVPFSYELDELNVCVLDIAEYCVGNYD